jgi:transcription elongation factor GreA-like protein
MKDITAYEQRVLEVREELEVYCDTSAAHEHRGEYHFLFPTRAMRHALHKRIRKDVKASQHTFRIIVDTLDHNQRVSRELFKWLMKNGYDVSTLRTRVYV